MKNIYNVLVFANNNCQIERFEKESTARFYAESIYPVITHGFKKCILAKVPIVIEQKKTIPKGMYPMRPMTREQLLQHEEAFINSFTE